MRSSNVVLDSEHLDHVIKHFSKFEAFSFDVETTGPFRGTPAHNQVTWLSLATYGMAVAIPMGHERGDKVIGERIETRESAKGRVTKHKIPIWEEAPEQLRPSQVFGPLEPLFFSDRVKSAHNETFDVGSVTKYFGGQYPPGPYFDTLISSKLIDENRLNGLKPRIKEVYKLIYDTSKTGKRIEDHPFSKAARYGYMDAKYQWLLYRREKDLCRQAGLQGVLNLGHDLIPAVVEMELNGAPINRTVLEELGVELQARLVETEASIYKAAGRVFNLNSPKQKAEVFYGLKKDGGLGLKPRDPTPGGKKKQKRGEKLLVTDFSTDAASLKPHKAHPAIKHMLSYQKDAKLLSTYVTGLLGDPKDPESPCLIVDGRVHGHFNMLGARTSRWSSSSPNLQNIPSRGEYGKKIRQAYEAEPGYAEVIADYGQIELVLMAHFIGYGAMFEGFHQGIDPHKMTASRIFKCIPDLVNVLQREVCKAMNFGIVYGAGPITLADMAGCSVPEMKEHLANHRDEFPEIYEYRSHVISTARRQQVPHVTTLLGHVRRIPELRSSDTEKRAAAERQIFNAKIQGSGSDVIKLAMVRLLPLLPERAELTMTVHDELMVHTPVALVADVESAMREAMLGEGIQKLLRVPLTSTQNVVGNWAEAK